MARRPTLTLNNSLLPPQAALQSEEGLDDEDLNSNIDQTAGKAPAQDIGEADDYYEDPETGDWIYGTGKKGPADEEEDPDDEPDPSAIDLEEFFQNLAEDDDIRQEVEQQARMLHDLIKEDIEARTDRDNQYAEGIKRTGLGKEAPGGANFEGASSVVHPILADGCIDLAAKVLKELLPPSGPVKTHIIGAITKEKLAKAERKRQHMNWQLTQQIKEYRAETEQLLTQVPLGGSQYCHWWWSNGKPCYEFMPIDHVILDSAASSFERAGRITIREDDVSDYELDRRVASGLFIDPETSASSVQPDKTDSAQATDKIEGVADPGTSLEGVRGFFTTYVSLSLESDPKLEDGEEAPYVISMEQETMKVVQIRRNWDPTLDQPHQKERMDWLVQWDFIRWRGALAIGLGQLIGSLSGAITGALRALMDSAHINNAATLIKLKGANIGGQSTSIDITGVAEVEGPAGIDDIRKLAMPMPFNPPSTVLFQLLEFMVEQAKSTMSTSENAIEDAGPNTPVGTIMAQVEQGSVNFSALHARFHECQRRSLEILHRINKFWLEDEQVIEDLGELVVRREDYEGPMDIIPVSDPSIFSEVQRVTQVQGTLDLNNLFPGLMNQRALLKRALQVLKIPNIEELLPDEKKPEPQNPVNENLQMFMGQPAFAFPDQDHEAHLQVLLAFAMDPNLGSSPAFMASFLPHFVEHAKQHIGFWYVNAALEVLSSASGIDMSKVDYASPESQDALSKALAEAMPFVIQKSQQVLAPMMPILNQASQMVQQMQQAQMQQAMMMNGKGPGGPPDPSRMAEVQRKTARDQKELQLEERQQQLDAAATQQRAQSQQLTSQDKAQDRQVTLQTKAMDAQTKAAAMARQDRIDRLRYQLEQLAQSQGVQLDYDKLHTHMKELNDKVLMNEQDNWTALKIAEEDFKQGKRPHVKNGNALGA